MLGVYISKQGLGFRLSPNQSLTVMYFIAPHYCESQ